MEDLCKSCSHFWLDFPLPLERYVAHCDIVDSEYSFKCLDEVVGYPCSVCPFNSYIKSDKV